MRLRGFVAALLGLAIGSGAGGALAAAGDPVNGKRLFQRCAACHTLEPGKKKIGPSLHGVIGRAAGSARGYRYSKAMAAYGQSGVVWAPDTLDTYLEAPGKVVRGTRMAFPGLKKFQDRADVISYLELFAD